MPAGAQETRSTSTTRVPSKPPIYWHPSLPPPLTPAQALVHVRHTPVTPVVPVKPEIHVIVEAPSEPKSAEPEVQYIVLKPEEPVSNEPLSISKKRQVEMPEKNSNGNPPESKKDFDIEPESKKIFDSPGKSKKDFEPESASEDEIEYDRDGDPGRWRKDSQVAEVVIYRHEWTVWPSDVPVETGLRSYYELRYFDEGTNRKGIAYRELYAKHRAKRDLWLKQYQQTGSVDEATLDTPTVESNVVHFPDRRTGSSN